MMEKGCGVMEQSCHRNAKRFYGFAEVYDQNRPAMPQKACDLILSYLDAPPRHIVDLGSGTGLSAAAWQGAGASVIGVEPSGDMLAVARKRAGERLTFLQAYADRTGLADGFADAVVCSQSFHWMAPAATLLEVNRILRPGGVFAAVDCDWPPVMDWQVEKAYETLHRRVRQLEQELPDIKKTFTRWAKEEHLQHIRESGYFRYAREIVFDSEEPCDARRLIGLSQSQGGLQALLKSHPEAVEAVCGQFAETVRRVYGDRRFLVRFCYRMRIGVK